jgi:hypothetical protein
MRARLAWLGLSALVFACGSNSPGGVRPDDAATDVTLPEETDANAPAADVSGSQPPDTLGPVTPLPGSEPCPDPPLAGTVRYVCDCGSGSAAGCVPGSDSADGTTPKTAWRSFAKAHDAFASFSAGGMVAFCRGGAIRVGDSDNRQWYNTKCQRDQRCVVRDYVPEGGSADLPRPILVAATGGLFKLEDSGDPDHDEGYVFLNLDLSGSGTAATGFFVYNDTDDVLVCNVRVDGFQIGVQVAESNPKGSGNGDGKNERIVVRNSQVTNNSGQGWLGACDGCSVEYSTFDNNGFAEAVFNHNIYFGGSGSDERIVGNVLTRSAVVNGSCQAVSLVVHGVHDGLQIEGNKVSEPPGTAGPGCWGIAVDPGYSEAEAFRNVTIARNVVQDVGNLSIGVAACDGCLIENNVVIQTQSGNAIMAPDRERGSSDIPDNAITVRNNSVLYKSGIGGTAIAVDTEGTGHVVVSNAIKLGGTAGGACFSGALAAAAYTAFDYNVCDPASGSWASGVGSIDKWASTRAFDLHSRAVDPGFSAVAPPYDLSVPAGSPLVGAGDPARSSSTTISGQARGLPPDVGAYQR